MFLLEQIFDLLISSSNKFIRNNTVRESGKPIVPPTLGSL